MSEPTRVTVSCAECARAFTILLADYQAEQERAPGTSRSEPWGARRPWFCSMPCLNEARLKRQAAETAAINQRKAKA